MRKRGEKIGNSIDEKPPKLNKETRRKTNHLFVEVEIVCKNLQNLAKKMGKKTKYWLIDWR